MKSTLMRAAFAAVIGFCCAAGSANATVYDLTNVTGANGDYVTGSFTIDPNGFVSQYSIATYNQSNVLVSQLSQGPFPGSFWESSAFIGPQGLWGFLFSDQSDNVVEFFVNTSVFNGGNAVWADAASFSFASYPSQYQYASGSGFVFGFLSGQLTQEVAATPLPATLPLYATGLGALALLRWRRKRKAAAA